MCKSYHAQIANVILANTIITTLNPESLAINYIARSRADGKYLSPTTNYPLATAI